ncbi:MAG TPA: AAA family ATPase [Candidatus Saccharimonadales bacterium]|nr:AAA family ATPase [Candidatus Saccharimonadales bacterium]
MAQHQPKLIALVGMPGSGKGTCTDHLSEKYKLPLIHFGQMMYEEVQRRGLDNVNDEKFVREDMRKKEGPAVLAKMVARKADGYIADGAHTIVLDGLYSWSEYKYLREKYGDNIVVIAVAAPRLTRYERVLARTDGHRKYTSAEQVEIREIDEIEHLEKGGPIAFADYTLVNDREGKENLLRQVDELVERIGI